MPQAARASSLVHRDAQTPYWPWQTPVNERLTNMRLPATLEKRFGQCNVRQLKQRSMVRTWRLRCARLHRSRGGQLVPHSAAGRFRSIHERVNEQERHIANQASRCSHTDDVMLGLARLSSRSRMAEIESRVSPF